jgi:acyl carrier protein
VPDPEAEVMDAIRSILAARLEVDRRVRMFDRLTSVPELDSLGIIVLAVGLEDRFRVKLREEDAPGLKTFADLVRLVVMRRQEAAP